MEGMLVTNGIKLTCFSCCTRHNLFLSFCFRLVSIQVPQKWQLQHAGNCVCCCYGNNPDTVWLVCLVWPLLRKAVGCTALQRWCNLVMGKTFRAQTRPIRLHSHILPSESIVSVWCYYKHIVWLLLPRNPCECTDVRCIQEKLQKSLECQHLAKSLTRQQQLNCFSLIYCVTHHLCGDIRKEKSGERWLWFVLTCAYMDWFYYQQLCILDK